MSNVREFWLTNRSGKKYSLHRLETFLNNPAGLGYGVDIGSIKIGHSNMIVSDEYDLGTISGELLFIQDRAEAYQQYFEFVRFLYDKPIQLHYLPPNTFDSYYCQVRIVGVEKSEVNHTDSILHVPIQMFRQTLWYTDRANEIVVYNTQEEGKKYALQRPYHYGAVDVNNVQITNAGVNETPILVTIEGETTDPMFSIYDSNSVLYGRAKILGTYDNIEIDSDDLTQHIALVRNGSYIPNAINYQDLTVGDPREVYVTFLKLQPGTSKMTFSLGDSFEGNVKVQWRDAYVTV